MLETEGSVCVSGDPSVIRQDRADATSLNEAGEVKSEHRLERRFIKLEIRVYDGVHDFSLA